MLNRDMIKECLAEFNKDFNSHAFLKAIKLLYFDVELNECLYSFDYQGNYLSAAEHCDYLGKDFERYFKAYLNSLDNSKIDAPNHYTLPSGKQLIELLQSDLLTRKEFIGFCKGNVYKYVSRYQAKNHREDLEKAKQYLNFLEGLENGQNENE